MQKNKFVLNSLLAAIFVCCTLGKVANAFVAYEPTLEEKKALCADPNTTASITGDFCSTLAYLRIHIQPLDLLKPVMKSAPVVFFGDTHPNTSIKEWLGQNMKKLKELGFTHIAMEALNSTSQPLINSYKTNSNLRSQVLDLIANDWGWKPDAHVKLIDSIIDAGIEVLAIDNRETPLQAENETTILQRNQHMAEVISGVLKGNSTARIAVLTGCVHSKTSATVEGVTTIPEILRNAGIENISYTLESGEDVIGNPFAAAYLSENLNGSFLLPMPRAEALIDGIIFTPRPTEK